VDRQDRYESPRELAGRIIALLEADLQADGLALLDVRVFQGGGRLQIRIYLDTLAGGITLDEVARASRTVGILMDEADLIAGKYVIEVSSPGIRRPLRTADHYRAVVGQRVDLKIAGVGHPGRLKGILTGAGETELEVTPDEEGASPVTVSLEGVLEGNLDADFDPRALINADRRRRKEEQRQARQQKKKPGRKSRPRKKKRDDQSPGSGS